MSAIRSWSEIDVKAEKYFDQVTSYCKKTMDVKADIAFIVVDHCLQTFQTHIDSLSKLGRVAGVILKSSTRVSEAEVFANNHCKVLLKVTKEDLKDAKKAISLILDNTKAHEKVVIMDHGGYFACALKDMMANEEVSKRLIGIAEVTENGHVKLEKALQQVALPSLSVARSQIKELEDAQTGVAICDATNKILYDVHCALNSLQNVCVIGYGKIGRSIANSCKKRGMQEVTVIEVNPLRAQLARIEGNRVVMGYDKEGKARALQNAQVLFSATGSKVLAKADVANLRKAGQSAASAGTVLFIASCTSPDDEFDASFFTELEALSKNSNEDRVASEAKLHLSPYDLFDGRKIYILNEGKSVNFAIGGTPGFEICQVWAGVLYTAAKLASQGVAPAKTVQSLAYAEEMAICQITQSVFFGDTFFDEKAKDEKAKVATPKASTPLRRRSHSFTFLSGGLDLWASPALSVTTPKSTVLLSSPTADPKAASPLPSSHPDVKQIVITKFGK
jgi:adenosylhomocysteinase